MNLGPRDLQASAEELATLRLAAGDAYSTSLAYFR